MAEEDTQKTSDLADFEQSDGRPAFVLTRSEVKLLGIAGVGFFLDAYDLFIINPVATMLQYRLYGGGSLPTNLEGLVKAGANIGSVIGQFAFGYAADAFGRKAVYGKELMLIILATILTLTTPTGSLSPDACLIYLSIFRILLGIGVGGDYPMSASITSDRANLRKRGTMLAYIFSNQGWGSLAGSLVTIIVLAIYKHAMDVNGETSKVDGVWRIVVGVSLVPAFATLYQRLTLPESTRFLASQKLKNAHSNAEEGDAIDDLKRAQVSEYSMGNIEPTTKDVQAPEPETEDPEHLTHKKAHFKGNFYGINLNQNVVLQQIGFDGKTGTPWERLFKVSTGNIIITALGFVPGYWATVLTIEKLGRKWIQIQGFLLAALFRKFCMLLDDRMGANPVSSVGILAGKFTELSTASFIYSPLVTVQQHTASPPPPENAEPLSLLSPSTLLAKTSAHLPFYG
ncbi:hypothetical protein C0991_000270, partial [Blastosporella zonata]